jgi:hypothetical protein
MICVEVEKSGGWSQRAEQEPGIVSLHKPFAPSHGFSVSHAFVVHGFEL